MYTVKSNANTRINFKVRGGTKDQPKFDFIEPGETKENVALANRSSRYIVSLEATRALVISDTKPQAVAAKKPETK